MSRGKYVRSCKELLCKGFGSKPCALRVRRGPLGCMITTFQRSFNMPPYHGLNLHPSVQAADQTCERVKDTTGGGNAFLGGYCLGLLQDPVLDQLTVWENAAIYGSVAASFIIEQFGLPTLSAGDGAAASASDHLDLW